jgi:type I restriction enzyme R subunit
MNEAETRAEHIDPALRAAGWGVVAGSRIRREFPLTLGRLEGAGRRGQALTADYVLEYRHTKLAVVEAKALAKPLTEGLAQAKNYAGKLALRFAYATNGRGLYAVDLHTGAEGEITSARYPTPDELWAATFPQPNAWRDQFAAVTSPNKSGSWTLRSYQEAAIRRVMEAVAAGKNRLLLTLATGTGKTSIAFQIAWKLFEARWNLARDGQRRPRILFLADRNNLANQAFNDFNGFAAFEERGLVRIKPDEIRKRGAVPTNGAVFFTIFQTFLSGPPGADGKPSPYFGDYPADFFDFIIIDECHRGGANDESSWREILTYFAPAVQLGLTATPKRHDNIDTYAYFGEPVYIYSLKDGINDGFLTPFRVRQISTTLDDYVYTQDDIVERGVVEEGRRYEEKDFNRVIEIPAREKKRVDLFMAEIDQRQKTLVFCASQEHALAVRDYINQIKKSPDPNYCARVTADDGELGEQHLREFQDNEKTIPTILTTSQKLSTGVDARNIRSIVLLRPVNSMIEFKQIIGRGTRLYDGKDYFTIYDFVKAHHHFSDPEWDGEPLAPDTHLPPDGPRPPPPPPGPTPPPPPPREKITIRLADGKARTIQHMMLTTFWHPDGTPMSSQQFVELLFGQLPEFFQNEAELRTLWSAPDTRARLLAGLAEKGFGRAQLAEMQRVIDAPHSDLFDVLAYVAYLLPPLTREQRAAKAKVEISTEFNSKQRVFLEFVLSHYVTDGVDELASEKLTPLLRLKYHDSIADAVAELGRPEEIGRTFASFQKHLYREVS